MLEWLDCSMVGVLGSATDDRNPKILLVPLLLWLCLVVCCALDMESLCCPVSWAVPTLYWNLVSKQSSLLTTTNLALSWQGEEWFWLTS